VKTEYIAFSPHGALAIIGAGVVVGLAIQAADLSHAVALLISAGVLALYARSDAKAAIANGTYSERKCVWRRDSAAKQTIKKSSRQEPEYPTALLQ
jgi:hydroxymethylglutaryl-CoA reductase